MCTLPSGDRWCTDGRKDDYKEYLRETALIDSNNSYVKGNRDFVLHNETTNLRIGVHKNYDSSEG